MPSTQEMQTADDETGHQTKQGSEQSLPRNQAPSAHLSMSEQRSSSAGAVSEREVDAETGRPILYILILILSIVATYGYKLRTRGIFACPADGYRADAYLAYCNSDNYGDYDHGALWFGLEPKTLRSAEEAEVLFVGSSRMQFAFSSSATEEWFSLAGVPYYLLGFSHEENMTFTEPLLEKLTPQAKVYVINLDRFFQDSQTPPAREISSGKDIKSHYNRKRLWQPLHRAICTTLPAACGNKLAFFRSSNGGSWQLKGSEGIQASQVADGPISDQDHWEYYAALGEEFISGLPVERECVLLTIVPWEATKRDEAMAIAAALGLVLVAPQLDGLSTFDGSHLDPPSAERWARAFFEVAGPQIRRCLEGAAEVQRMAAAEENSGCR